MKKLMKHPTNSTNSRRLVIVLSHSQCTSIFQEHKLSLQTVIIHNTSIQPARSKYAPIAFVSLASIGVQNVLDIILLVPKTIFQHQAEFSRSKEAKSGVPMMCCIFLCIKKLCSNPIIIRKLFLCSINMLKGDSEVIEGFSQIPKYYKPRSDKMFW